MTTGNLDLDSATITETGKLLRERKLSPVELTQATIDRMERLQPVLLSFITPTPEYALQRAKEAEKDIMEGRYRGPLHGIPYTLKDWMDAKGIPTTFEGPSGPAQHYMPQGKLHHPRTAGGGRRHPDGQGGPRNRDRERQRVAPLVAATPGTLQGVRAPPAAGPARQLQPPWGLPPSVPIQAGRCAIPPVTATLWACVQPRAASADSGSRRRL